MPSQTISTRVTDGLYRELNQFCLDNCVSYSDVLKYALLTWRDFNNKELPEYLKNRLAQERADLDLRIKMRKLLFLNNVQRKIRHLVINERLDGDNVKLVIIPLIEVYRDNAQVKGYKKAVEVLNEVLESSKGIGKEVFFFMQWTGLIIKGYEK